MRLEIVFPHYVERFFHMANAALEAQIHRATDFIGELQSELSTANSTIASLSAAVDSEDAADAAELSTALDGVGAPAASVSVAG